MENPPRIVLREVLTSDLPLFFEQQLDPQANWMAAFTRKDPTDKEAFLAHWSRILQDETTTNRTILFHGQVAGSVASYVDEEQHREVTYWLGKPFWGNGLATAALSAFLEQNQERALYARAAKDNLGSLRVLEKCGFLKIGADRGFSQARGEEVEEFLLRLD